MNLINPVDTIINYINQNKNIESDKKKVYLYRISHGLATPIPKNNQQIKYFIEKCNKENNIRDITRLYLLLIRKLDLYPIKSKVFKWLLLYNSSNDDQFYNKLRSWYQQREKKDTKTQLMTMSQEPQRYYAPCVSHYIRKVLKRVNMKPNDLHTYLDIGIGFGKKTYSLGKELDVKKVIGADIDNWCLYGKKRTFPFQFVPIDPNKQTLDLPDHSVDLVTCIHSLHHIKQIKKMISEIARVSKHGSLLVIVEHNIQSVEEWIITDVEHELYERVMSKDQADKMEYYSNYYFWIDLEVLLMKYGYSVLYYDTYKCYNTTNSLNETKQYMVIYQLRQQ